MKKSIVHLTKFSLAIAEGIIAGPKLEENIPHDPDIVSYGLINIDIVKAPENNIFSSAIQFAASCREFFYKIYIYKQP